MWGNQSTVSWVTPGLMALDSISSTPLWSLHQLLQLSSCLVWVLVLTSLGGEQQCESVRWINPFFSNLLLGHDVSVGKVTLRQLGMGHASTSFSSRASFAADLCVGSVHAALVSMPQFSIPSGSYSFSAFSKPWIEAFGGDALFCAISLSQAI